VILRPEIPSEWGSRITLTAGVALAEAIHELGIRPELKWPNDIMIGHRKVAGILTEARLEKKGISSVIVGVGVNIKTSEGDFPKSMRAVATSLQMEAGRPISRVTLLQHVLRALEGWYTILCEESFHKILHVWRKYETIMGRMVEVSLPGSQLFGVAEDLDSDGRLLIRDKEGRLHRIVVGDVVHCRLQSSERAPTG
jgi:BirA family biotin operon repressor/biotin-[acetyl-CoA-carboxylase] ligase